MNAALESTALTQRQEEICGLLRKGLSNKAIAGALGISEGTVKNHISEILKILNATNRTQAAQLGAPMFDTDEYLHLALHAAASRQPHACMTYLKEALRLQPRHAMATYLLAAQHAELGLLDRAMSGMKSALSIEPRLEIARFQLALLLLDTQRNAEAAEHLNVLRGTSDVALRAFSEAMLALVENQRAVAREKLIFGLSQKCAYAPVPPLMKRFLETIEVNPAPAPAPADPAEAADNHVFLGAYRQSPT